MTVAGDGRTGVSGGVGSPKALSRVVAPATGAEAATVARALLHRMLHTPGRPQTRSAAAEDEAMRWVLQWTGEHPPPGRPRDRARHQLALLRRYHRTTDRFGNGNRYSQALLWAYQVTGRL